MGARTDKIFGRTKQAVGAITGNKTMKREGQRQEDKGKLDETTDPAHGGDAAPRGRLSRPSVHPGFWCPPTPAG
jgi:uncharacterized protein YjbJ (UPF0337 family)